MGAGGHSASELGVMGTILFYPLKPYISYLFGILGNRIILRNSFWKFWSLSGASGRSKYV